MNIRARLKGQPLPRWHTPFMGASTTSLPTSSTSTNRPRRGRQTDVDDVDFESLLTLNSCHPCHSLPHTPRGALIRVIRINLWLNITNSVHISSTHSQNFVRVPRKLQIILNRIILFRIIFFLRKKNASFVANETFFYSMAFVLRSITRIPSSEGRMPSGALSSSAFCFFL